MTQWSKKSSLLASLSSLPTGNASAETETAKEYAENEAITATKQLWSELQAQERTKLQEAEDTLGEAERVKGNADAYAARVQVNIDTEHSNSVKIREDAEVYSEEIQNSDRTAAEALMTQTRAGADEMASRMRRETSEDIRKTLTDVEVARASAEDELETQWILTETARVRAFSHGLAAENAEEELARTNKPEAKPAPVKRASARKAKVTSINKAA